MTLRIDSDLGIRDPFDRMIVAAARTLALPILSADERIAESGLVDIVWT